MVISIKDKIKNINAVIGCNIGCRYCYAKAVANRFHLTDDFSKPIADLHKLERLKKPGVYFLTGMSDLYLWKKEWLDKSFELLRESPKTVGVYLTKAPNKIKLDDVPDNAWMGVTITSKSDLWRLKALRENIKCRNYHSYQFDGDDSDTVKDNLRSPQFIYNLLSKFDGEKKCALCGCKIERIIQAAHIYPVADIRKRHDLDFSAKFKLAVDGDNGIWLCENHHKLFDSGLIWFEEGKLCISKKLNSDDLLFVKQVTTIEKIEPRFINERMLAFFDSRAGIPPRVVLA